MSAIDGLVHANTRYVARYAAEGSGGAARPLLRLAIVACMDARLDLFAALGLGIGDAHVIRNAGGRVTDDVLRSLAISQRELGTCEVALLHHTQCGLTDFDDAAFRAELATESGAQPAWDVPGFGDPYAGVRESIERVRACPWLPHRDGVRGFVFDVATATIDEVR